MPNEGFDQKGPGCDDYETPAWLFKALDTEFAFTLDGAASHENTKCLHFSSELLPADWGGHRVFCNPPYSNIEPFVELAIRRQSWIAVLLLPVRSDSDWWADMIASAEIRWFRKRIRFELNGVAQESPRFPTIVLPN